jgi:hypothetical protein
MMDYIFLPAAGLLACRSAFLPACLPACLLIHSQACAQLLQLINIRFSALMCYVLLQHVLPPQRLHCWVLTPQRPLLTSTTWTFPVLLA